MSQGFHNGNSTGIDNSTPQGLKQGKQHISTSHKQHDAADPNPPGSAPPPHNASIPHEAGRSGAVADHAHDIKKAERAMHQDFKEARLEAGHPTSGAGRAPGGPTPQRK